MWRTFSDPPPVPTPESSRNFVTVGRLRERGRRERRDGGGAGGRRREVRPGACACACGRPSERPRTMRRWTRYRKKRPSRPSRRPVASPAPRRAAPREPRSVAGAGPAPGEAPGRDSPRPLSPVPARPAVPTPCKLWREQRKSKAHTVQGTAPCTAHWHCRCPIGYHGRWFGSHTQDGTQEKAAFLNPDQALDQALINALNVL